MAVERILAPMLSVETGESLMRAGISLAHKLEAHLSCYGLCEEYWRQVPGMSGDQKDSLAAPHANTLKKAADEDLRRKTRLFEKSSTRAMRPGRECHMSWSIVEGGADALVCSEGRVSDLILLPRGPTSRARSTSLFEAAIFSSGKPVLITSTETEASAVGSHILIAWNCSSEAARAVSALLPLLERAEQVHILSVGGQAKKGSSPVDLARALRRHGIFAEVSWVHRADRPPAELLQEKAKELSANLIIMGAFARQRGRRGQLGDVTRFMLEETELPIATCH